MLGAIIGDIAGSAYEFHNTKDYHFKLFLSESNYTDDSVMTMAVAHWLLTDPEHTCQKLEDVRTCSVNVWTTQPVRLSSWVPS